MTDISLLHTLLTHYSPTGSEHNAVAWLVDEMSRLGYASHIDAVGNAVGMLGSGPREIVLLGHIDTVPGEIEVRQEGDRLYGRGSVDAKGPLACFTAAVARLGARPGWRIAVIGAVAEEGDSHGAYGVVDAYHPEMTIIGEPSGWQHVTLGYKGSAWFHARFTRSMAHTASQAESACEAAVNFWNAVNTYANEKNAGQERAFARLTPTLRGMNSSQDGFSQSADLNIGFRLPPGIAPADLSLELQSLLLTENDTLTYRDGIAAYRAEKNTPLVRAFLAGIRSAGGTPGFVLKTGTADMNIVAPAWNCPAVAYGPGDSDLDHTPNEHILISEYLKGIEALTSALKVLTADE
jgi:[amino group carrier protein]-lysine/ornithine hydrolase